MGARRENCPKQSYRDAQEAAAALFINAGEENIALFIFSNHSQTSERIFGKQLSLQRWFNVEGKLDAPLLTHFKNSSEPFGTSASVRQKQFILIVLLEFFLPMKLVLVCKKASCGFLFIHSSAFSGFNPHDQSTEVHCGDHLESFDRSETVFIR